MTNPMIGIMLRMTGDTMNRCFVLDSLAFNYTFLQSTVSTERKDFYVKKACKGIQKKSDMGRMTLDELSIFDDSLEKLDNVLMEGIPISDSQALLLPYDAAHLLRTGENL